MNTSNDELNQEYELVVLYGFDGSVSYNINKESILRIDLEIDDGNQKTYEHININKYYNLYIGNSTYRDYEIRKIKLPRSESLTIKGQIYYANFGATILIEPIRISKITKTKTDNCLNKETVTIQNDTINCYTIENNNWYSLTNITLQYTITNTTVDIENVVMNIEDYFMTLQSYHNRGVDGLFRVYYDNGRKVLFNVKGLLIKYGSDNNRTYNINECAIASISKSIDKHDITTYEFLTNKKYKVINKSIYNNGKVEFIERTYDYYDNILSEKDHYNIYKHYVYLPNGELNEITTINCSEGLNSNQMVTVYDKYYTGSNYCVEKLDLLCLKDNEEAVTVNKTTIDINTENTVSEMLPNYHLINYTYNIEEGYMEEVYTTLDTKLNKNEIINNDNILVQLKHNDTNYEIIKKLTGEVETVKISNKKINEYTYTYNSHETEFETKYSNSNSIIKTYDKFNRLTKIEGTNLDTLECIYSDYVVDELDYITTESNTQKAKLRKTINGTDITKYYYDLHNYSLDYEVTTDETNYDNPYNQLTKEVNDEYTLTFGYDEFRRLKKVTSYLESEATIYLSTLITPVAIPVSLPSQIINSTTLEYNDTSINKKDLISKKHITLDIIYNLEQEPLSANILKYDLENEYDYFNRLTKQTLIKNISDNEEKTYSKEYTYCSGTYLTSSYIKNIEHKINNALLEREEITYDSLGNITSITYSNNLHIYYKYDNIGRLIREDNEILNKTYVFEYDSGGNIINKNSCNYTRADYPTFDSNIVYNYDNEYKDKLIKYGNNTFSYEIGTGFLI